MADETHEHGKMDIEDHEKTFHGFINFMVYGAMAAILVLLLAAIFNA